MIKYSLKCKNLHQYESWFASSEAFEKLKISKLLSCEVCGSTSITKSLMAPSVKSKKEPEVNGALLQESPREKSLIEKLKKKIESTCEYVGDNFAEEARAIHEGKSHERSIYGKTTIQKAKSLLEDEIPITPLPWHDRKSN